MKMSIPLFSREKKNCCYYAINLHITCFQADMWNKISNSLNAVGSGPQKQPKEWMKVRND